MQHLFILRGFSILPAISLGKKKSFGNLPPGPRAFGPDKNMSDKWTKLHVTKLWVKDGVRQKWCVTELWAKNAVCVSTMVYGKVGHDKVHVTKVCAQEWCVCVFVWQRYDRSSGGPNRRKLCVKICCGTKNVWQTKCVTKLREKKRWDKDGVWLRWRLTKIT